MKKCEKSGKRERKAKQSTAKQSKAKQRQKGKAEQSIEEDIDGIMKVTD